MRRKQNARLWNNRDFMKLWSGETVSLFGSQLTSLALPLSAALTLHATSTQMGNLVAAQFAPYLLITLFAGIYIDKRRRRPIMIAANLGRAVLLGLVPLSFLTGFLRMEYLYIIVFLTSLLSVLFELSYQAYFPCLVERTSLVEGNSKLQMSASIAQVSGPGIAGVLISLITAPMVIVFDALSFLISATSLASIRKVEPEPVHRQVNTNVWREIGDGIRTVLGNPYLRAIACEAATYNVFSLVTQAVLILYMTRQLHMASNLIGFIMGASSVGSLLGSALADLIGRRFSIGPTIIASMALACTAPLLVPLAGGPVYVLVPVLVLSFLLGGVGLVVSQVYVISLRQAMIPEHMLGRVNASYRFICSGATPIGAFVGGQLGHLIGLRLTLVVGAVGTLAALGWVLLSPVAKLNRLPR